MGFKIGLELMVRCRCSRVVDVPITFQERTAGESKVGALSPETPWGDPSLLDRTFSAERPHSVYCGAALHETERALPHAGAPQQHPTWALTGLKWHSTYLSRVLYRMQLASLYIYKFGAALVLLVALSVAAAAAWTLRALLVAAGLLHA